MQRLAWLGLAAGWVLLAGSGAAEVRIEDAFDDPALPLWTLDPFHWQVREGQLRSDVGLPAWLFPVAGVVYRSAVCEVVMTPLATSSKGWKVAGLSLHRGDSDFWHIALVEQPDAEGKGHFVELCEMKDGKWLAQNSLRGTAQRGHDFDWQFGTPYRLRLELTPAGIDGRVLTADGTEVTHIGFAFSAEAVTEGRPALRVSGVRAVFDDFRMVADRETAVALPPKAEKSFPEYAVAGSGIRAASAATGFFRVEKDGDRWWFVDPRGERFYAVGTDHVNYRAHWCQKLGYAPYHRNCEKLYGSAEAWAEVAAERLRRWGFNTLGAGNIAEVRYRGLAHTLFAAFGSSFSDLSALVEKTTWTGFPNVFDPRWEAYCTSRAQAVCAENRNDPWLLGYFLDNELEWYGKSHRGDGIWTAALAWPADHSGKRALVDHLRRLHGDIAAFNRVWGQAVASWEDVAGLAELPPPDDEARAVQTAWLAEVAERYFAVSAAAIRRADPNHLVIGSRFAGNAPEWAWKACARHCDVVTFNHYPRIDFEGGDLSHLAELFGSYHALVERPMMVTEWSFPALDSGLPCKHGAGMRVDTQEQKAMCYEVMQHLLFRLPFLVGSDYFMWADEPELGISDTFPEDSNYGLVNVDDKPYPELTAMAAKLNPMACRLHAGTIPEIYLRDLRATPDGIEVTAVNAGPTRARAEITIRLGETVVSSPVLALVGGSTGTIAIGGALPAPAGGARTLEARLVQPAAWVPRGCRGRTSLTCVLRDPAAGSILLANTGSRSAAAAPVLFSAPVAADKALFRLTDGTAWPAGRLGDGVWVTLAAPLAPSESVAGALDPAGDLPARVKVARSAYGRLSIDNGVLRLEHDGSSGNILDRVFCGGVLLGRYNPLIWQQPGGDNQWTQADELVALEAVEVGGAVRLTVTARRSPDGSVITAVDEQGAMAARRTAPVSFEATHTLVVFPGVPFFVARCTSIRNADPTRPLPLRAVFYYLPSAIGGDVEGDLAGGGTDVPNYYRTGVSASWHDPGFRARYGCLPLDPSLKAHFWRDPGGGQHPDARLELAEAVVLPPGERFIPPATAAVLVYGAVEGGPPGATWNEVQDVLDAVARVRPQ
ncbi:MAG: hypothetical protein JXR77_17085 [Lentisphaeria bacterium]|nr:hypothetical protein [Lentisphaeria bacterium]